MSKSVNKAILLGNVGKDPEIRSLPNGAKAATLSLATTETYKDAAGAQKDRTEWHTVVAYGRLAEVIETYVKKGAKLYIEGRIQTRGWDDKRSGEKKYSTEIHLNEMVFAGPAPAGSAAPATREPGDDWDNFR